MYIYAWLSVSSVGTLLLVTCPVCVGLYCGEGGGESGRKKKYKYGLNKFGV